LTGRVGHSEEDAVRPHPPAIASPMARKHGSVARMETPPLTT
jgi:hypothetical protein